jgi:hypothetical protein
LVLEPIDLLLINSAVEHKPASIVAAARATAPVAAKRQRWGLLTN